MTVARSAREHAKRIELITRKWVDEVLTGQYRSHFRGQGVQFAEHRVYQAGDDVRHIDWKASARTRDPLIKKFDEERELNVLLVLDASGSLGFGSTRDLKSEVVALVAGILSYAALKTGDRVGALFFTDQVEHVLPPKKGRNHGLRVVQEVLTFRPKRRGTNLRVALEAAHRVMKHAGIVFVLSDFQGEVPERELLAVARSNDVVGVRIRDPGQSPIGKGWILVEDPEGDSGPGGEFWIDTSSYAFRTRLEKLTTERDRQLKTAFARAGAEWVELNSAEECAEPFVRFLERRRRRKGKPR